MVCICGALVPTTSNVSICAGCLSQAAIVEGDYDAYGDYDFGDFSDGDLD